MGGVIVDQLWLDMYFSHVTPRHTSLVKDIMLCTVASVRRQAGQICETSMVAGKTICEWSKLTLICKCSVMFQLLADKADFAHTKGILHQQQHLEGLHCLNWRLQRKVQFHAAGQANTATSYYLFVKCISHWHTSCPLQLAVGLHCAITRHASLLNVTYMSCLRLKL